MTGSVFCPRGIQSVQGIDFLSLTDSQPSFLVAPLVLGVSVAVTMMMPNISILWDANGLSYLR